MKRRVENPNPLDRPMDEEEIAGNFRKVYFRNKKFRDEGICVIVDIDKYALVCDHYWYCRRDKRTSYAFTSVYVGNYKSVQIQMHRLILNADKDLVVDHINHNGLDNRTSNLRQCTVHENHQMRMSKSTSRSKYRGVFYFKETDRWGATININGKQKYIGLFRTEIEAALAYDCYSRVYKGEFRYINLIDQQITMDDVERMRCKLGEQNRKRNAI